MEKTSEYIYRLQCIAFDFFRKKGFPSSMEEDWKFTDLKKILRKEYGFFLKQEDRSEDVKKNLFKNFDSYRIIFVNGVFHSSLSKIIDKNVFRLYDALKSKRHQSIIEKFYAKIAPKKESLVALNTSFAKDGVYVHLPNKTLVKKPIEILYFFTSKTINFPRNLIVLEEGSFVQIIERHQCLNNKNEANALNNSVTEIYASPNSKIKYLKIQDCHLKSSLMDNTFIVQKKNSSFSIHTFSLQGSLIRNNLHLYQKDEGVNSQLKGLSISLKEGIIDHHTLVDHLYPTCNSYELYKSIFSGKAKGVFNGKIIVRKKAKNINAFQKSINILLSKESCITAKPQLEIFANDVKCSHGCTVGQFSESVLFYLRSRGIPEKKAKDLMLLSFIKEILDNDMEFIGKMVLKNLKILE
ncbi:MAG TPA: Fe-S cluster assembly protein SufD [Blattabacteriaceae bacterium]